MSDNLQGDTSVLTKLFQHNTWANLKLLNFCESLPATTTGGSHYWRFWFNFATLCCILSAPKWIMLM